MQVILSIKPIFAKKIFSGEKKYEYRRQIFKKEGINSVILYASAPISMIIGEFQIENILYKDLDVLWEETKNYSGINEEYYYNYFSGKEKGYAIKIKNAKEYLNPVDLKSAFGKKPPQSFTYIY